MNFFAANNFDRTYALQAEAILMTAYPDLALRSEMIDSILKKFIRDKNWSPSSEEIDACCNRSTYESTKWDAAQAFPGLKYFNAFLFVSIRKNLQFTGSAT